MRCPLHRSASLLLLTFGLGRAAAAASTFGGSLDLTSDYFVRGISRSNDEPALQLDLHYVDQGFVAGLFASNTQIDPGERRDVELSPFLGYVVSGPDWQGKALVTNYTYPWNADGSSYNYTELDLDALYHDWLDIHIDYSPDFPRYYREGGLTGVDTESVSLTLQKPLWRRLAGSAGAGYVEFEGRYPTGYAFWSAALSYDCSPVTLVLSVVGTSRTAETLFYNAAGNGHVAGTVIYRF